MKEFYTADNHSKARKLPLFTPNGKESKDHMMILGRDCLVAREAKAEAFRVMLQDGGSKEDSRLIMIASFIDSWSFKEDCTTENKIKFLKKAPYISDSIDIFAGDNNNFVKK